MNNPILLCTVGGAHQPIIEAIGSTLPGYVCFFCTDRDSITGKPGSVEQVTGEGLDISGRSGDGIVEAIESADGRLIGVQFHPERMPKTIWVKLFEYLVKRAAE